MSSVRKILGQEYPSAGVATVVYTVPVGKQAVVSTFTACNLSTIAEKFTVAVVPSGESISSEHIIFYNAALNGEDTFVATIGLCLNAGDEFQATSLNGTVAFTVTGQEITQ